MCSTPDVNGTWTPTERMTEEQRQARFQANLAANNQTLAAGGSLLTGSSRDKVPGANDPFQAAARDTMREQTVHNMRADADQRKLAAWDRQGAKTAQAPGRAGVNAAVGGGGPSSLITGGTASDALASKKPRTGQPSLLGG